MKTQIYSSILTLTGVALSANVAYAQTYQPSNRIPVADNTLGTQVSGSSNNFNVTGGLSRGQNLFHSFQDFSVPTNGSATFTNPAGNQSIITRVTGNQFSDINGKVDTNGANFFLINPNGIVFGNNVQLNVGKSFVSSTANGIDLVDPQGKVYTFGAKNINDIPLLTVNPNVFLNVSRLNMGASNSTDVGIKNYGTLQTNNDNQYIGLIGGNVTLDGSFGTGDIIAPGGRVDLGGLNTAGTISIDKQGLVFYGNGLMMSDVSILNGAWVNMQAEKTLETVDTFFNNVSSPIGNVNISANNIKLFNDISRSGIRSSIKTSGGDINIRATGQLSLNLGEISTDTSRNNQGAAGNINISAQGIAMNDLSSILSYSNGEKNAGNINIQAKSDISISGRNTFNSTNLNFFVNKSSISSKTFGKGDSGKVTIDTQGILSLNNEGVISSTTAIEEAGYPVISQSADATGNSQGINISARNLSLKNHSVITASTGGKGNGGNIAIKATGDIILLGSETYTDLNILNKVRNSGSSISSYGEEGSSGLISIEAKGKLLLSNDSHITNNTTSGNSKGINISAQELVMKNASNITSNAFGGNAGNINIQIGGDLTIINFQDPNFKSTLLNDVLSISNISYSTGNSGKISIDTKGKLSISNNGTITSNVEGVVDPRITGNSLGIQISAKEIDLSNSSYIFSTTNGTGTAGNINIRTTNALNINDQSGILAGNRLYGSQRGRAGNISIDSGQINIKNGSGIGTESLSLTGGNITLTARDRILLQPSSDISTNSKSAEITGDGGNITINSPLIIATPGDNNITANASAGSGGRVNITSQGLFGIQFRPSGIDFPLSSDITASSTFGQNGTVKIDTPNLDPGKDATQLPIVPIDSSNQISQTCNPDKRDSSFAVTGRGGLPKSADDLLANDVVWQDSRAVNQSIANRQPTDKIASPAIGWISDGKGRITLVAAESQAQPIGTKASCQNQERK